MSDDRDAAKPNDRPVEPPVIDVEAEASGEEPDTAAQAEANQGATSWRPAGVLPPVRGLLVVCAVLVLAGLALWVLAANGFRFTRDDGRMAAMAQRIEVLETTVGAARDELARLATLAAATKSALDQVSSQPPQGLDALQSRMDATDSALRDAQAAIEAVGKAASGGATDADQLASLTGRIDELQHKLAEIEKAGQAAPAEPQKTQGSELAAAFAALEAPLTMGQPFAAELEKIAGISPVLAGIDELRPHAASGAPSVGDLALGLETIADREVAALPPAAPTGEQGLWVGLRDRISGLVKVRDLGDARWADGMAAASRQLAQGDSQQAVATLQAIEGTPPEELKSWLAEAQARAAVDRAAQMLAKAVRGETAGTP